MNHTNESYNLVIFNELNWKSRRGNLKRVDARLKHKEFFSNTGQISVCTCLRVPMVQAQSALNHGIPSVVFAMYSLS